MEPSLSLRKDCAGGSTGVYLGSVVPTQHRRNHLLSHRTIYIAVQMLLPMLLTPCCALTHLKWLKVFICHRLQHSWHPTRSESSCWTNGAYLLSSCSLHPSIYCNPPPSYSFPPPKS